MKQRFKSKLKITQRYRLELIVFSFALIAFIGASIFFNFNNTKEVKATTITTETLSTGSFIVNMGITPQTTGNALRPYGMIYDLVVNYQVPVKWVISQTKIKDAIDFTHNGVNYRGSAFIVPAEFINSTIASRISFWQTQGVQGNYSVSPLTLTVYHTITSYPWTMIDTTSRLQQILINYFNAASIPSAAYAVGTPAGLTDCFDVWANPHGDPTWSTHSYLRNFVTVNKSWVYAQCHSVSMMEFCRSSTLPVQQLNFLSTTGLKCWGSAKCGTNPETHVRAPSSPFTYFFPNDPVMQFMGTMHGACLGGSEQWFQPLSAGQWYNNTRRGVTTGTGTAPKEGTVLVYGPAYGDSTNGWTMYLGGHALDSGGSSVTDRIAGMRAFHNYLLQAGKFKRLNVSATMPTSLQPGQSDYVSATVSMGTPPYTYQWSSQLGGTFSDPLASNGVYTAPNVTSDTVDIIRVRVTDQCGRVNFVYQLLQISPPNPLPVKLLSFTGARKNNVVELKWRTASEVNNDYFTISRSQDGENYQNIGTVAGNGTTSATSNYSFIDQQPLSGKAYYRLSQTDFDGTTETFAPIIINGSKGLRDITLTISPNPVEDLIHLIVDNTGNDSVHIQVIENSGKMVYSQGHSLQEGRNDIEIDGTMLLKQVYSVVLTTTEGKVYSQKLIKK